MSPLIMLLILALVAYAAVSVGATGVKGRELPCPRGDCVPRAALLKSQKRSYHRLLGWRRMERDRNRWKRVTLARPSVREAINLAGTVYGNGSTLWRRAKCETGGSFNPYSRNPSSNASGLLQFLPSTWRSTPFAGYSVWSPYANALAAGWMMGPAGRGGEWQCR